MPPRLSDRVAAFVQDVGGEPPPGHFWPAWLVAQLRDTDAFTPDETAYLTTLGFQAMDRQSYFHILRALDTTTRSPPTTSK